MQDVIEDQAPKVEEHDNGPYTQEDINTLESIKSLRMKLITNLVGDNDAPSVPHQTGDKLLLQALIDGAEKQVHTTTKVKMAKKAQESEAEVREEIKHLLMNYKEPPRREVTDEELQVPSKFKRPEFAKGALDQGVVPVTMKELGL